MAIETLRDHGSEVLNALGTLYRDYFGDSGTAREYLDIAARLSPSSMDVRNNIVTSCVEQGKYQEAISIAAESIRINGDKDDLSPFFYCAYALSHDRQYRKAAVMYRRALSSSRYDVHARYNLALCLLSMGDYAEGWDLYDSRFDMDGDMKETARGFPMPAWDGSDFRGSVLLFNEQGTGDFIHMARYLPLVEQRVGKVVLNTEPILGDLFGDVTASEADKCLSVNSLPRIFSREGDLFSSPYIHARKPLNLKSSKFKVGVAWSGNPGHWDDRHRSCSLSYFRRFAEVQGVELYLVQPGQDQVRWWKNRQVDLREGTEDFPAIDLGKDFKDFSDTANALAAMDLVISVDTATAHLAGSMGIPTWIALPLRNDWRWGIVGDSTAWYPSVKLFRQDEHREWDTVFENMHQELQTVAGN